MKPKRISLPPRQYHVYLSLSITNYTGADACPNLVTSNSTTAIEYELPANTGLVLFLPDKYVLQVTQQDQGANARGI